MEGLLSTGPIPSSFFSTAECRGIKLRSHQGATEQQGTDQRLIDKMERRQTKRRGARRDVVAHRGSKHAGQGFACATSRVKHASGLNGCLPWEQRAANKK